MTNDTKQRTADCELRSGCDYPLQPSASTSQREHRLYPAYSQYVAALNRQLVTAMPFAGWLEAHELRERGHACVFQVTSPQAALAQGWYCNVFAPRSQMPKTHGPFATELEAKAMQS